MSHATAVNIRPVNLTRDAGIRKLLEKATPELATFAQKVEEDFNATAADGVVTAEEVTQLVAPLYERAAAGSAQQRRDSFQVLETARAALVASEDVSMDPLTFRAIAELSRGFDLAAPAVATPSLVQRASERFAGTNAVTLGHRNGIGWLQFPFGPDKFVKAYGADDGYATLDEASTAAVAHARETGRGSAIVQLDDRWVPIQLDHSLTFAAPRRGWPALAYYRSLNGAIGRVIDGTGASVLSE